MTSARDALIAAINAVKEFWNEEYKKATQQAVVEKEVNLFRAQVEGAAKENKIISDSSRTIVEAYRKKIDDKENKLNAYLKELLGVDQNDIIRIQHAVIALDLPDVKDHQDKNYYEAQIKKINSLIGSLPNDLKRLQLALERYADDKEENKLIKDILQKIGPEIKTVLDEGSRKLKILTEQFNKSEKNIKSDEKIIEREVGTDLENVGSAKIKRAGNQDANEDIDAALKTIINKLQLYRSQLANKLNVDSKHQILIHLINKEELLKCIFNNTANDKTTLLKYLVVSALINQFLKEVEHPEKIKEFPLFLNMPIHLLLKITIDANGEVLDLNKHVIFNQSARDVIMIPRQNLTFIEKLKNLNGKTLLAEIDTLLKHVSELQLKKK